MKDWVTDRVAGFVCKYVVRVRSASAQWMRRWTGSSGRPIFNLFGM